MVALEEPDSGRAWIVAFAACIINAILSGISRMIGILYVAVIETYGVTRAEATLPFTVRNSIRSLSGPLVGIFGQRYGIKTVTFFGGLVAAAGAGFCSFAPTVIWLDVFWGGIHGLGFAFANTLIQVVVGQYFEKYKVTASGIALSGACVGSLGFPILVEWILDSYGLSGGFLILAGFVLNVLPPALLLSSPQWITNPEEYKKAKQKTTSKTTTPTHNGFNNTKTTENIVCSTEKEHPENGDCTSQQIQQEQIVGARELVRSISLSDCPIETMSGCSSYKSIRQKKRKTVFVYDPREKTAICKKGYESSVTCTLYEVHESPFFERRAEILIDRSSEPTSNGPSEINTIFKKTRGHTEDSSKETAKRNPTQQSFSQSFKCIVKLYANPLYVLLNVCLSTYVIIFIPILTVLVDYGHDKGFSESDGKYLINALAVGDLFGRLGFGWVTERKFMTIPNFMFLVLALQGVFIALFPLTVDLTVLVSLLVLYGMTAGANLVLFPVLVFQYVDVSDQPAAVSCAGFLSGLVSFGIAPMIGHFRDEVGSYDGMFYLTGLISLISGVLWLMEPMIVRHYYRKENKETSKVADSEKNSSQNYNKKNVNGNDKKYSR